MLSIVEKSFAELVFRYCSRSVPFRIRANLVPLKLCLLEDSSGFDNIMMEGQIEEEEHALFNSVVFDHLLEFLKLEDLKSVRQVCKQWKSLSSHQFRIKAYLKFLNENDFQRYLAEIPDGAGAHINFVFRFPVLSDQETCILLKEFGENYGLEIRELQFLKLGQIPKQILSLFPNLEILTLDFSSSSIPETTVVEEASNISFVNKNLKILEVVGGAKTKSYTDWAFLCESFPNVQVLGSHCQFEDDLTNCLTLLDPVHSKWPKLHDFSSALVELRAEHISMLLESSLQFSSLYFFVSDEPEALEATSVLLQRQNKTLRSLQLYYQPEDPSIWTPFCSAPDLPVFQNLRSLNLLLSMVSTLDFLKLMPKLRKLDLTLTVGSVQDELEESVQFDRIITKTREGAKFAGLKSLSFEARLEPASVQRLANVFPDLEKFTFYGDDRSLQAVWTHMGEMIRELVVLGSGGVGDEGITGIPKRALSRGFKFMQDYRSFSYVGNMKRLLSIRMPQPQPGITDHSVLYGFSKTKSLLNVQLCQAKLSHDGVSKFREDQAYKEIQY